jgi:hypothetical protein
MAFIGYATEAKTKRQMHFIHSAIGGYYDIIFETSRPVFEYLLAHQLLTYCEDRRVEFQARFKELEKTGFSGLSEDDLEEIKAKQFLLHSETQLAGLLGEFVKERVAPKYFPNLVAVLDRGDREPLDYIYGIVEQILTQMFLGKMKASGFQLSRYFKSPKAWPEIREYVRGQMRILARIANQDPIANFSQMLVQRGVPA